jgi:hypothetical protein
MTPEEVVESRTPRFRRYIGTWKRTYSAFAIEEVSGLVSLQEWSKVSMVFIASNQQYEVQIAEVMTHLDFRTRPYPRPL